MEIGCKLFSTFMIPHYLLALQFDNHSNNFQITFVQCSLPFTSTETLPVLKQRGFLTLVLHS